MDLSLSLKKIPYFPLIARTAEERGADVWLVGGFLRDTYRGRRDKLVDFDFCVEKQVLPLAKVLAARTEARLIVLDQSQGSYRLVLKRRGAVYTYDFTRMRGGDLRDDLSLRDFSINTLAVKVNGKKRQLIDYFGARADIRRKRIRFIREEVFPHDPLRILRGFSFMANYGFRITPKTEAAMVKYRKRLGAVSGERINEELFKIFAAGRSYPAVRKMSRLKIIDEVIPYVKDARGVYQGKYHHLRVWEHSLETLRKFEELWQRRLVKLPEIARYFREDLAGGRRRIQILKLACLLHDLGKPAAKRKLNKKTIFHTHEKIGAELAEDIARRLRLSLREREVLKKLVFWHLRPGYLADQVKPSPRAVYRFFRDTQEEGVAVIVLSLSDWRATRGPQTSARQRRKHETIMLRLIASHLREKKTKPLPVIVNGHDIMRKFKLSPSPLIGRILRKVKEEQALGKVTGKAAAYAVAKKMIT